MKVSRDMGKFLSVEDVKDQELIVIAGEGEETKGKFGDRLQIEVKVGENEKVLTLNPTSKNNLIDAYGDDTSAWIGKEARVHLTKSKIGKELKDVIYLTHPNKDLEGNIIFE